MSSRIKSGKLRVVHCLGEDHNDVAVLYCAVDPKEETLATCCADGKINLWTIATGQNLRTLSGGHTDQITSCAFSSIGNILASSSLDKKVILWHYKTGKRASRLELHSAAVLQCTFSKDGKLLASASRDKTARLYKIRPGAGEFVPGGDIKQLVGHTAAVNCIQFSPDAAMALTGSDDMTICVWRQDSDWSCVATLGKLPGPVKGVIFSPVDPVFASLAGNSATVWTMHGTSYNVENSADIRSSKQLKAISFIPDGRHIVGVASDATINIWDSVDDNVWNSWKDTSSNKHNGAILTCCFAGRNFISADETGCTFVWELIESNAK